MSKVNKVIDEVLKIGEKNNPNNMSLLDSDNYESLIISFKDLEEIRAKYTEK